MVDIVIILPCPRQLKIFDADIFQYLDFITGFFPKLSAQSRGQVFTVFQTSPGKS